MSAIVSRACRSREPEIGPRLENGKWRVLIGWRHTDDTTEGIREGKIWAGVSSPPEKLQIFDEAYNRGGKGEIRFCGVGNFTMVRMFHKYWCLKDWAANDGTSMLPPKDGISEHKRHCREKYKSLIRKHRIALDLPAEELGSEEFQQSSEATSSATGQPEQQKGSQTHIVTAGKNNESTPKSAFRVGQIRPPQEFLPDEHSNGSVTANDEDKEMDDDDDTQHDDYGSSGSLFIMSPSNVDRVDHSDLRNMSHDDEVPESHNNAQDEEWLANFLGDDSDRDKSLKEGVRQENGMAIEPQDAMQLVATFPTVALNQDQAQATGSHDISSVQDCSAGLLEFSDNDVQIKEERDDAPFEWPKPKDCLGNIIDEGSKMNPIEIE